MQDNTTLLKNIGKTVDFVSDRIDSYGTQSDDRKVQLRYVFLPADHDVLESEDWLSGQVRQQER